MSDIVRLNIKGGKLNVKLKNDINAEGITYETTDEYFQKQIELNYKNGFDDGVKAARAQLESNYQELVAEKFGVFENYMLSINDAVVKYEYDFETIVFNLAVIITEKIISREVEKDNIILKVITDSLKKVLGANNLIVKLNPADLDWINSINPSFIKDEKLSKVKFSEDDTIERGGCIVESEIGNVDARISSQLTEIKRQLELVRNAEVQS